MYLGIDLGTSSVKIILMNKKFTVLAKASSDFTVQSPQLLWSEQDPHAWWLGTCAAMHQLKQQYPELLSQVKAIGLAGQMHGATLLDKDDNVLRQAILWNDGRSFAECEELERRVKNIRDITCNRVMPGFTAPKLLWVKQHEPEIFKGVAKVLLPKDYVRLKMSGVYATDMSDASGTSWLDVKKRCWSAEILQACDLSVQHMPQLFEGNQVTATLLPEIAKQWGMAATVNIVAGAGDNAAGALSVNVVTPGSAFLSLGTSGVYFIADDAPHPNPQGGVHTFAHCLPHLWHQMNCHLSVANCIDWLAGVAQQTIATLLAAAERRLGQGRVFFLPYLSGERSPHNDPYVRGTFIGIDAHTTSADLMLAVLEGIAFNFALGQEELAKAGTQIDHVFVVGGGARSLFWGKILASALQRPLIYGRHREVGAALGAARLAYLAEPGAIVSNFPAVEIETIVEPDAELLLQYEKKIILFKRLYSDLKNSYQQIYETIKV